MKKGMFALTLFVMVALLAACTPTAPQPTATVTPAATSTQTAVGIGSVDATLVGQYTFTESVSFMGNSFQNPFVLTLNADGSYTLLENNPMMGPTTYRGSSWGVRGPLLTTGPIQSSSSGQMPMASWFNSDHSCQWTLNGDGTVTPVKYTKPASSAAPNGQTPTAGTPPGGASVSNLAPSYKDLAYETNANPQHLDLYLPTSAGLPSPVVIYIHPGAFQFGDSSMIPAAILQAMLKGGYAVAAIDYRLSGEAVFPAAVEDAKAAVRFLRANAAKYNLNPDKIAAYGESAGGNIAAMVGVTGNIQTFDDASLGYAEVSSAVQAVIDWYGPTDFLKLDEQAQAQGCDPGDQKHNEASSPESAYMGGALQTIPAQVEKSNPIPYISNDTPPFLIEKGDKDCTVAIENTKMLADALTTAHRKVQYVLLPNVGHGDDASSATPVFTGSSNIKTFMDFLNSTLGR